MTAIPPDSPNPSGAPVPPAVPASTVDAIQAKRDANQLKLVMVFHWVWAGLMIIGIGMVFLHQKLMSMMLDNPEMWEQSKSGPPPEEFFAVFQYVYLAMGITLVLSALVNALSAYFIRTRRNRTLSVVVAGLNCLMFPFGTAFGVFAIIVLIRESVVDLYEAPEGS